MAKTDLTAARLREALIYNPETGSFTRRVSSGKAKAGTAAGGKNWAGYIQIRIDSARHMAHRLAWLYAHGSHPTGSIDHIDGDPLNNRLCNLRDVPHGTNMQNQRQANRRSRLGVLGVTETPKGKFVAKITVSGRTKYIGSFGTAQAASDAYVKTKRALHGGCTI